MSKSRDHRLGIVPVLVALLVVPTLLGCEGDRRGTILGVADALVACSVASGSIAAGSTVPVQVTAFVTRGGVGSPGERVQFETDRGDVSPFSAFTNAAGLATSNYFPPSVPGGTATIDILLVDGRDEVAATCEIAITAGTSDPLLSVSVQTPPQLAGLALTVRYDPAFVDLPDGAVQLLGSFAGGDCLSIVEDDDLGEVQVVVICPTMRPAAGADAARFAFQNVGGSLVGVEGFAISCSGVDETGTPIGTLCQGRITQL